MRLCDKEKGKRERKHPAMSRLLLLEVCILLVLVTAVPVPKPPVEMPTMFPSNEIPGSSEDGSTNGDHSFSLSIAPTAIPTMVNNDNNFNNDPAISPTALAPNSNNPSYSSLSMTPFISATIIPTSPTPEISNKPTTSATLSSSPLPFQTISPSLAAPQSQPTSPLSLSLSPSLSPSLVSPQLQPTSPLSLSFSPSPLPSPSPVSPQLQPTSPLSLSLSPSPSPAAPHLQPISLSMSPSLAAPSTLSMSPSLVASPSLSISPLQIVPSQSPVKTSLPTSLSPSLLNSSTYFVIYYASPTYEKYHLDEDNNNYVIITAICSILECEHTDMAIEYVDQVTQVTSLEYPHGYPLFKMKTSFKTPLHTNTKIVNLNSYNITELMNNSLSDKTLQQYIRASVDSDNALNNTIICGPNSNDYFCDISSFVIFPVTPTAYFARKCSDYKMYTWNNSSGNIINGYVIWVLILYFFWFTTLLLVAFALCKRFVCSASLLNRSLISINKCLNWFIKSSNRYDLQATLESCKLLQGVIIILLCALRLCYFVLLTLVTYKSKTNNFACAELAVIGIKSDSWNRNILLINTMSYPLILLAVIIRQVWHLAEMRNVGIITHCRQNNRCHMAILDLIRKYLTITSIGIIIMCCLGYAVVDPNITIYTYVCNSFIIFSCCAIVITNQYNLYGLNGLIITKDLNFVRYRNSIDLVHNIINTTAESAGTAETNSSVRYPEIHDTRTCIITSLLAILNILIMIPVVISNYYSAFIIYSLFSKLLEIVAAYLLVATFTIQGDTLNQRLYRQISNSSILLNVESNDNAGNLTSLASDIGSDSISKQKVSTHGSISSRGKPMPYKPLTIISGGSVGNNKNNENNDRNWLSDWLDDVEWEYEERNNGAPDSPSSVTESFLANNNNNNNNNSISPTSNKQFIIRSSSSSIITPRSVL